MDTRKNLLQETIDELETYKLNPTDVRFITDGEQYMTWEDFVQMANYTYDSGFGGQEVKSELQVVGEDWWLERHEYDGKEWWEFKKLPVCPDKYNPTMKLKSRFWWDDED